MLTLRTCRSMSHRRGSPMLLLLLLQALLLSRLPEYLLLSPHQGLQRTINTLSPLLSWFLSLFALSLSSWGQEDPRDPCSSKNLSIQQQVS